MSGATWAERAAFADALQLDEATLARFDAYAALLEKWQARINLVGPATLPALWSRHFLDSAQIALARGPAPDRLVDIGTGAGFPGLVLALLWPETQVHLIDSDQRKMAFCRQVALATGIRPVFHVKRADSVPAFEADMITARACAPLEKLVPWAHRFSGPNSEFWFLKGREASAELTALEKSWTVEISRTPSRTEPSASLVRLTRIRPRTACQGGPQRR